MNAFAQAAPMNFPAVTNTLGQQFAFAVDVSQKLVDGIQRLTELNLQVARAVLSEASDNTRQILSVKDGSEALSAISARQQPSLEKVRAYQQHVQNILTETQQNVSQSIQAFVPQQTRAVQELVQTAAQRATEQTAVFTKQGQDALQQAVTTSQTNVERAVESVADAAAKAKATTK